MRFVTLVMLFTLVQPLTALASDAPDARAPPEASLPEAAEAVLADLRRALLDDDAEAARVAVQAARADVFNRSLLPTDDALAAWERAAARADADARARALTAEAALLEIASRNVAKALDEERSAVASAWLQVILDRGFAEPRGIPVPASLPGADEAVREAVLEARDAALAARAREAVVTAMLLHHDGLKEDARAFAAGAGELVRVASGEAGARLPAALALPLATNATRVPDAVAGLPEDRAGLQLTGLLAPLVALEYDRDVEVLDELALRNVDAAYAAARAASEDRVLASVLGTGAIAQYAADRAALYARGEGTLEAVDAAYEALDAAVVDGAPEGVLAAARDVQDALRPVALLERGIVLKVEVGGVQIGREHLYKVTLVRPPLEGLQRYEIGISYDDRVVRVLDYVAKDEDATGSLTPQGASGVLLSGEAPAEAPLRRSVHLGHLRLEAAGVPGEETPLTIRHARFVEPDGDDAEVFRLRDGHVTVARVETGDPRLDDEPTGADASVLGDAPPQEPRATPLPGVLPVAFAAAAVANTGRRLRAGRDA